VPPADHSWCAPRGQDVSRQSVPQDVPLEKNCQALAERGRGRGGSARVWCERESVRARERKRGKRTERVRERE